jgi:hypothetical protein
MANLFYHYQYTVILFSTVLYITKLIKLLTLDRSLNRDKKKIENINVRTGRTSIFLLIEEKFCWALTTVKWATYTRTYSQNTRIGQVGTIPDNACQPCLQ